MDLPQVKTAVKVWEKAFKAKNKREPTKDDIKRDPSGIAEQYALYRKLSKVGAGGAGGSAGPSSQPPSSSASGNGMGTGGFSLNGTAGNQRTPRIVPNAEYPTTPTPPARRSGAQRQGVEGRTSAAEPSSSMEAGPSQPNAGADGAKNPHKRTASKANLEPPSPGPSTSLHTYLTPRKSKPQATSPGYVGPVLDPNPLNPFLASPSRSRISPFGPAAASTRSSSTPYTMAPSISGTKSTSPFIHASSPRKLKEVLEANSLRKVRERMGSAGGVYPVKNDNTPRTRARKRLRGEVVDDTPGKAAPGPRRKRGQREDVMLAGKKAMILEDDEDQTMNGVEEGDGDHGESRGLMGQGEEDDEDEDDGMGPSPLKPMNGERVFTSFSDIGVGVPTGLVRPKETARVSLKARLDAARPIGAKVGNDKGKGKASAAGVKADAKQTKMNTFFQRAEKVPKNTTIPDPPPKVNGSAHIQQLSGSSSIIQPPNTSSFSSERQSRTPEPAPNLDLNLDSRSASPPPTHMDSDPDNIERLPTPPLDPEVELALAASLASPPRSAARGVRRVKRIMPSSDEDEPGSSGSGAEDREIVIVSTRPAVDRRYARRGSLDSVRDDLGIENGGGLEDDEEPDGEGIGKDEADAELDSQPSPTLPPHLLSLLSLRSPTKPSTRQKSELVVKALFDPEAARRLKAIQRGQDVRVGGDADGQGDDEESGLEREGYGEDGEAAEGGGGGGVYGDDDWEEEDEGWKRPGEDMEEAW